MPGWLIVGLKEVRDHSRDTRALGVAALYALMGPAVVFLVSRSSAVEKGGPRLLVALMSVFALVSAFTSGMHVALDTAAGERERGSLVALLLTPCRGSTWSWGNGPASRRSASSGSRSPLWGSLSRSSGAALNRHAI
jgi:hypothetical protein